MLAESQQKEFSMELEKDFNVHEDYQKLKQAVVVLIENAFRYTDEGDNICIRFYAEEKNGIQCHGHESEKKSDQKNL
jgi:K+-sensing histidine kinase KdpD